MELKIEHTTVFKRNFAELNDTSRRFIVNQGGSRSSKTYSLMQLVIVYCLTHPNKLVSIVRKTFPSLRGTVMREFFELLRDLDIYRVARHHKTTNEYRFENGSVVEFFSVDDEQKLRGRKRDILWANEANDLTFEEFNQLNMRTTEKLFFDFNPSDDEHWLYELVERDNSTLIKSTYTDNPFLSLDQVKEIEYLINVDENWYKIYALGEKPIPNTRIYTHFGRYSQLPAKVDDIVYGLDFGYNHPTVLVKAYLCDGEVYIEEMLYDTKLTSIDIVQRFIELGVEKGKYIYADYARPEIIEELRRSGFNMKEANKAVKEGINSVKTTKVYLDEKATNSWKEYKMYSWKTNGDRILDEPIKMYDDAMDAIRYAIHSSKGKKYNRQFSAFYTFK